MVIKKAINQELMEKEHSKLVNRFRDLEVERIGIIKDFGGFEKMENDDWDLTKFREKESEILGIVKTKGFNPDKITNSVLRERAIIRIKNGFRFKESWLE